jgi:hypothetical protein
MDLNHSLHVMRGQGSQACADCVDLSAIPAGPSTSIISYEDDTSRLMPAHDDGEDHIDLNSLWQMKVLVWFSERRVIFPRSVGLKFLFELAAGMEGISNPRHQARVCRSSESQRSAKRACADYLYHICCDAGLAGLGFFAVSDLAAVSGLAGAMFWLVFTEDAAESRTVLDDTLLLDPSLLRDE